MFLLGSLALTAPACRSRAVTVTAPFDDRFERDQLGPDWLDTGGGYRVTGGKLLAHDAYIHPAWLK